MLITPVWPETDEGRRATAVLKAVDMLPCEFNYSVFYRIWVARQYLLEHGWGVFTDFGAGGLPIPNSWVAYKYGDGGETRVCGIESEVEALVTGVLACDAEQTPAARPDEPDLHLETLLRRWLVTAKDLLARGSPISQMLILDTRQAVEVLEQRNNPASAAPN